MSTRSGSLIHRLLAAVGAAAVVMGLAAQALVLFSPSASGSPARPPTGTAISYSLLGCRGSAAAYETGTFVCPPGYYTTGNLGKGR